MDNLSDTLKQLEEKYLQESIDELKDYYRTIYPKISEANRKIWHYNFFNLASIIIFVTWLIVSLKLFAPRTIPATVSLITFWIIIFLYRFISNRWSKTLATQYDMTEENKQVFGLMRMVALNLHMRGTIEITTKYREYQNKINDVSKYARPLPLAVPIVVRQSDRQGAKFYVSCKKDVMDIEVINKED